MKPNVGKYPEVRSLPKNALTVKEYAARNGITTSYVYKLIKDKRADFKIIVFQSINFVIANK